MSLAELIARRAPGERPRGWRLLATAGGLTLFGLVLPTLLVLAARWLAADWGCAPTPPPLAVAAWLPVPSGLGLSLATVIYQVTIGRGSPIPWLPTQRLLTGGPYRLCRNPMVFGVLVGYLGLLLALSCPAPAVVLVGALATVAAFYHRLVEERELALRFGEAYLAYRARTPCLVPTARSWREFIRPSAR